MRREHEIKKKKKTRSKTRARRVTESERKIEARLKLMEMGKQLNNYFVHAKTKGEFDETR